MRIKSLLFLAPIIFLFSCEKKKECVTSMVLRATPSITPTVGDNVVIIAPEGSDNDVYQWNGPGVNLTNQSRTLDLYDIKLSESGTYNCGLGGNGDCNPVGDTILINVQLKQETPPCTPTNNTVTSTSLPNVSFSSVTQSFHSTWNAVSLYAYAGFGYPGFTVLWNSYNGTAEPRDGTHVTAEGPSFNILQEPNEISISFIYNSNYYHCEKGKNVYVSHVGGKLRLTFCNLSFYSSPAPSITCSGRITEL